MLILLLMMMRVLRQQLNAGAMGAPADAAAVNYQVPGSLLSASPHHSQQPRSSLLQLQLPNQQQQQQQQEEQQQQQQQQQQGLLASRQSLLLIDFLSSPLLSLAPKNKDMH